MMERKIIIRDNKEIEIADGTTTVIITASKTEQQPKPKKTKSMSNAIILILALVLIIIVIAMIALFPKDKIEALNNTFSVLHDILKALKRA